MRWLHLSDIHFGFRGYESKNVRKKLIEKINTLNLQMDFILITGDCLYQFGKTTWDQKATINYIKDIVKACKCPNKRVYICPGNHDVDRDSESRNKLIQSIRDGERDFWSNYNDLFNYGHDRFQLLYKGVTSTDYEAYKVFSPRNAAYRIVSIDTCLLSKDNEDCHRIRIFNEKINDIEKEIKKDERINILIMHHGIECFELTEAKKFEHWVEDNGIDIVCCGHTHRAAVNSYDDLEQDIKQFTAGAVIADNYAIPGFYICESCEENTKIEISLYTYTKDAEKWVLCNQLLRKFKNGKYIYELYRHKNVILEKQNSIDINSENSNPSNMNAVNLNLSQEGGLTDNVKIQCLEDKQSSNFDKQTTIMLKFNTAIDEFNAKYFWKYESNRIYTNKNQNLEKFDFWKIVHSLVNVGVNYLEALELTCQVIEIISSPQFESKGDLLSSEELRDIVYQTIIHFQPSLTESEFNISCWASRYARKYSRSKEILVVDKYSNYEKMTYYYIRNTLLKKVIDDVTNNKIFYEKIFRNELTRMAESVLEFLNNMGVFEIREEALLELVKEYITQKPHPWLVNGNRDQLLAYHKEQGKNHICDLYDEKKQTIITQMEAAYHICAAILVQYDDYIGCMETSPLTILVKSVNNISNKDQINAIVLPMQRFQIIQLKKDLEIHGIEFENFKKEINILNKNIVNSRKISLKETRGALINLWQILLKIEQPIGKFKNAESAIEMVRNIFVDAIGFIVKANLRGLSNCFWVEPNWEKYEIYQQHLGKQILVCVLKNIKEVEKIYEYLYMQNRRESIKEITFVLEDFSAFSSENRKEIRNIFKGKYLRCIFIQTENFKLISKQQGWRNIFYKILESSKIS